MELFLRSDLETLLQHYPGPLVSIYLPTHRSGPRTEQNSLRIRHLLHQAQEELAVFGLEAEQADTLLAPLSTLLADRDFLDHPGDGLAAFRGAGYCRAFRLPLTFAERVVVGERFYVKPLLPLATAERPYYVLALSENQVRLLECRGHVVRRLEPAHLPHNLVEALGEVTPEATTGFHSAGPKGTSMLFRGGAEPDEKDELGRYFRRIDTALIEFLGQRKEPLVLAGVDYLLPLYRTVSHYPHLMAEGISGNPDILSDASLRESAWPLVRPYFLADQRQAAKRYADLAGTGRASSDPRVVLKAAGEGRIDVLFLAGDSELWGRFDSLGTHLQLHPTAEPGDQDLLNAAAALTLTQGGSAYSMARSDMPGGGDLAALFRY